jgi:transposase
MPCYVGLDASKRTTDICVIDETGAILKEGVVESDPKAIVGFLRGEGRRYARVGMESWSLASWLYAGLARAGLPIICIEARHSSALLKAARQNKTDRNDARGISEIMRAGVYKTVHIKSPESQNARALLTVRKFLSVRRRDVENLVRGMLLSFGLKLFSGGSTPTYEGRVGKLVGANATLASCIAPLITLRRAILREEDALNRHVHLAAAADPVCRRLMTAPGVGPIVALTYRTAVDEPLRFRRSRDVAAHLGLIPRTNQSGQRDARGHITKRGDAQARSALVLAARHQLLRKGKPSWLRDWTQQIAARRGRMKSLVATARRLAVILHKMWVTETDFCWTSPSLMESKP